MRFRQLAAGACLLLLSSLTLSAQMSGTYTLDPNGTGSRNFKSFAEATFQLVIQGVSGPVTIEVAPGVYKETWGLVPINGASSTNKIRFLSKTPLAARLGGTGGTSRTVIFIDGILATNPVQWFVLEGLEFYNVETSGIAYALRSDGSCNDLEILNCRFNGTLMRSNTRRAFRWNVHHNVFVGRVNTTSCSLFEAEGIELHHNEFQLVDALGGISISGAKGLLLRNRVYNNLVWGTLKATTTASGVYAGLYADVDHNSILVDSAGGPGPCLRISTLFGMYAEVRNNVFYNLGSGPAMRVIAPFRPFEYVTDGNLFWAPQSKRGLIEMGSGTSSPSNVFFDLRNWQNFSGQDKNSLSADPMFVNSSIPPYDLKLRDGSPAAAKAFNTRPWIKDDFAGKPRPAKASIGAFEGKPPLPPTTFTVFGQGCAGTGSIVPSMGYAGDLKLGSSNFSVTVKNAMGGVFVRAFFAIGASKTTWNGSPLPLNLGGKCNLLVAPHVVFPHTVSGPAGAGNGSSSVLLGLPNDPRLKGALLHFQWAIVDPAAAGMGLALSDGATLRI